MPTHSTRGQIVNLLNQLPRDKRSTVYASSVASYLGLPFNETAEVLVDISSDTYDNDSGDRLMAVPKSTCNRCHYSSLVMGEAECSSILDRTRARRCSKCQRRNTLDDASLRVEFWFAPAGVGWYDGVED